MDFKSVLFCNLLGMTKQLPGKGSGAGGQWGEKDRKQTKGSTSLLSQLAFIHTAYNRLRMIILDGDFYLSQPSLIRFYTPVQKHIIYFPAS